MRRRRVTMIFAGSAVWLAPLAVTGVTAAAASAAGVSAVISASGWGRAIEVPGSGALNAGGNATVNSVSCGSAGNCVAGGSYVEGSGRTEAFVAVERDGRWAKAIEVPGSGALNVGGFAVVSSVSCASAGNCAAGGYFADGSVHSQAFVAVERDGRWGKAIEVPGSGALNAGGFAAVSSVSCTSAGNCAAGGTYVDGSRRSQAFVAVERDGRWRKAIEVPGSGALNAGGNATVNSVSCGSAGNCVAGGYYRDGSGHNQAFVVSWRNGRWHAALQVPGSAALNVGGNAVVYSVSCGSAGNCAAGGFYADGSGHLQALVAVERHGRWGKAIEVPGSAALNAGGEAVINTVSCGSAGNCAGGGFYSDGSGHFQALVVSRRNGRWHAALEVPGSGPLNAGGAASAGSVSCPEVGRCAGGGRYEDGKGLFQAFVVSQT